LNKVTKGLKEAILDAIEIKGRMLMGEPMPDDCTGMTRFFLETAEEKDRSSLMTLVGKVLPTTIAGDKENPLHTTTTLAAEDKAILERYINASKK